MLSAKVLRTGFFYRIPPVADFVSLIRHSLLDQKLNVGCFLKRVVDLVRVSFLHTISRNHSNMFLLINLQKTKTCPNKKHCSNDYLFRYQDFDSLSRFLSIA